MSREYRGDKEGCAFSVENKAAIRSAIDLEIVMFEGEKLNEMPDGVGVEFEQFTAQHKRAMLASRDLSLLFALSQHFIILLFGE